MNEHKIYCRVVFDPRGKYHPGKVRGSRYNQPRPGGYSYCHGLRRTSSHQLETGTQEGK